MGIKEQVDKADEFPIVLNRVKEWLESHELGTKYKFAVATDGFARIFIKIKNMIFKEIDHFYFKALGYAKFSKSPMFSF